MKTAGDNLNPKRHRSMNKSKLLTYNYLIQL